MLSLATSDPVPAVWSALVVTRGLTHERSAHWSTDERDLPDLGTVVASWCRGMNGSHWVIDRPEGLVRVSIVHRNASVSVAAETRKAALALEDVVREAIPEDAPDPGQVPITFWTDDSPSPIFRGRRLEMPAWDEIASNYAAATRPPLEDLVHAARPPGGGRLVLWHGPPGTGKTTALRALARAWRSWARLSYVTDPDAFLMDPAYMQAVLLSHEARGRHNVVVLEDTGDLLRPKSYARDGLSRLLNLTDGLLGQGLEVLVLATTNEPLDQLDPALTRPGRCAATVGFEPFSPEDAETWLEDRDADTTCITREATLADLYAVLHGRETATPARRPVGFAVGR